MRFGQVVPSDEPEDEPEAPRPYTPGRREAPRKKSLLQRAELLYERAKRLELPKALDPDGDVRATLDSTSLVAGTYTMFAAVFLVSFRLREAPVFFLVFSGLADASLLAHFAVSCVTGWRKGGAGSHEYIDSLREAFRRYLRSGGFALDLLTSLPIVLVLFAIARTEAVVSDGVLALLDALHVCKLLRCVRMRRELALIVHRNANRSLEFAVATSLISGLFACHVLTCLWAVVNANTGAPLVLEGPVVVVTGPPLEEECAGLEAGALGLPLSKQYGCAIYFALQTLLRVGYGRVAGGMETEAMEILIMVLLVALAAPVVRTLSSLSRALRTHYSYHQAERTSVLAFMKFKNMPEDIVQDASGYFTHCWDVLQGGAEREAEVFAELPVGLQTVTLRYMHEEAFSTLSVLQHKTRDNAFWLFLLQGAKIMRYLQGDVILRKGTPLVSIFVLKSGEVHDVDDAGAMTKIRRRPSYWGEQTWFEVIRGDVKLAKTEMRAASSVEVFVLDNRLLEVMIERDPYMRTLVLRYIDDWGATNIAEKYKVLLRGLRGVHARKEKWLYKEERANTNARPGAEGRLR